MASSNSAEEAVATLTQPEHEVDRSGRPLRGACRLHSLAAGGDDVRGADPGTAAGGDGEGPAGIARGALLVAKVPNGESEAQ